MKTQFLLLTLVLACSACTREEAAPEPDPAALDRLLASLEAEASAAESSGVPVEEGEKPAELDRLEGTIQKLDVDRVDPTIAGALIAR